MIAQSAHKKFFILSYLTLCFLMIGGKASGQIAQPNFTSLVFESESKYYSTSLAAETACHLQNLSFIKPFSISDKISQAWWTTLFNDRYVMTESLVRSKKGLFSDFYFKFYESTKPTWTELIGLLWMDLNQTSGLDFPFENVALLLSPDPINPAYREEIREYVLGLGNRFSCVSGLQHSDSVKLRAFSTINEYVFQYDGISKQTGGKIYVSRYLHTTFCQSDRYGPCATPGQTFFAPDYDQTANALYSKSNTVFHLWTTSGNSSDLQLTQINTNGTFSGVLKNWQEVSKHLALFSNQIPEIQFLDQQLTLVSSPVPDRSAERIIWKTSHTTETQKSAAQKKGLATFNIKPLWYFGYIDDVSELKILKYIYDVAQKTKFPVSWLLVTFLGEGASTNGESSNGFGDLGLDVFGEEVDELKAGGYLPQNFSAYETYQNNNEREPVISADFSDTQSGLMALSATLRLRRDRFLAYAKGRHRDPKSFSKEQLYFFTYIFFNSSDPIAVVESNPIAKKVFEQNSLPVWSGAPPSDNSNATFNAIQRLATVSMLESLGLFD
ncbi:MAG: hypothetical protein R3A11_09010 [Bdellovibrionota bacterium]